MLDLLLPVCMHEKPDTIPVAGESMSWHGWLVVVGRKSLQLPGLGTWGEATMC